MFANIFPISSWHPTKIHYLFTVCIDENSGKNFENVGSYLQNKTKIDWRKLFENTNY